MKKGRLMRPFFILTPILSGFLYAEEIRALPLLQLQQPMTGLTQKRLEVAHRPCVRCLHLNDLPCRHAVKGLFQFE